MESECTGLIPTWTVDGALKEVSRIAGSDLAAFMLPAVGHPDWNHPSWEPLWSAVDESGLPVVMHQ